MVVPGLGKCICSMGGSPPGNGWYAAFTKDPNRDHIHLMFLWHASRDNLPHSRRNLYYMHMDHSAGKWTSMKNEKLNTPLSFKEANGKVLIFDSKNLTSSSFREDSDFAFAQKNATKRQESIATRFINFSQLLGPNLLFLFLIF